MESLEQRSQSEGNGAGACTAACVRFCCKCIIDAVEYLSKISYAYMAVSGESFCTSAWNGFIINLKHLMKFYFATFLASMFVFMGTVMIACLNIGLFILFVNYITGEGDKV